MRDHALLVSGGTVTDAARVKGRSDLWELTVQPAGTGPVSVLAPLGRACADPGALCTADGRPLTAGPALQVPGPPVPGVPDQPEGTAVFVGGVDLEWNDVPGADSYDVQQYRSGQWTDLPGDGVAIAFYGAGAIISGLDPEAALRFRVRAANAHSVSDWSEMLHMTSTNQFGQGERARPDNEPAGGAPVIHGTAQVGESLTADITGIEDGNGLDRVQFRYQWVSGDGNADTDIAGATDSGYTLAAADVGKTIKVKVAFTDRGGYSETRTSVATGAVAARPNNPATGLPAITGTAQVGETLIVDTSGIADDDGLENVSYRYQWVANDGGTDADLSVVPDAIYTPAAADVGRTIKVKVSFTDDYGSEETLTSKPTAAVIVRVNNPARGEPVIRGPVAASFTLTADISGISDADGLFYSTFSYQWIANDGTADTDIAGATSSTHTLTADDEGKTFSVRVSFTDDWGFEVTLTSKPTTAVGMAPLRLRSASVNEDTLVLTYDESLDPSVTLSVSAFTVTVDSSDRQVVGVTVEDRAVVLVLASAVESGETVQVGYSRPAGPDYVRARIVSLAATLILAAESFSGQAVSNETTGPQPPAAPQGLTATANGDGTISLAWDDPADPTVAGHQILRRRTANDPQNVFEVLVYDTGSDATSFVDKSLTAWTKYKYRVRALNADGLSEESVPASVWNKGNGTTLVSNSTPSPISKLPVDAPGTAYLQGFTTGNQDATVESITLLSPTGVNSASQISVEIYEAVGNTELGERLHTLTAPRRLKNNEHATFTAQADSPIALRANTAYFVKIESVNDSFHLSTSVSDGEDAESASGWLLDDSCLLRDGTQYVDCDLSKALRISINGSEGTPPLPFLSMSNGRAVAGEGSPVEFAVTLSREAADAVTVEYSTSDGTATADVNATGGQDYTPVSGQTLTIAAGDTEGTISVSTVDDTAYEDNETFTLTLSNPSQNARLGSIVTATGTIINDDADMTLPPAAPQRLTATANDDGTVSLTWDDPADPTITGYQILRRRPAVNLPGIRKLLMDDTGSAAASFVDTETTGGTFYAYQVRARNGNGLSGNSTIANVLTRRNSTTLVSNIDQEPALTQPILMGGTGEPSTFLQGFKTGSQDARVESVTLTRPTDVSGGAELSVGIYEKGEGTLPGAHLYTLSPSGTLTSGQDATFTAQAGSTMSLSANTAYYLKVDHVAGSLSLSTTQSDAEDGESAPRWRLDDVCLNKDRTPSQYADCDFSKVLRVSINGVEVLPADIQPPAAPQGLTATGHDDGTISFTWDDPEDPAVSGYQVWRANAGFTTITIWFKKIVNDTGSAATSFVDTKTTAGTSYIYRVRARNAFGQSEDSNHASIDTPAVFEVSDTQDSTTLVSNTNQDPALTSSVYIGGPGDPAIYLQGFMTGSQDAQVESVTLATPTNVSNGAELTVGIYEKGENTLLGAQFYTLTPSGTLTSRRDATFTAQAGSTIRLSANTAYFVKVDHVAGSLGLSTTRSEAEDGESAPGWLVNNVCLDQVSSSSQVTNCGFSKALRISINGFEGSPSLPLLSLSSDAALSAFELEDHSGTGIALTPAFDPTTNVYTATVANVVDSVTLSTTKNHAGATVAVLTESGTSTPDEATVDVAVGDNLIKAMVSSEDGTVSRIYMVTVTRAGSAADEVGFAVQQQGASNTPTTGQPTITGTAQVGEMLTADTSGITDDDGLNNAAFTYQWLGDDTDIAGATSSTYTLAETATRVRPSR